MEKEKEILFESVLDRLANGRNAWFHQSGIQLKQNKEHGLVEFRGVTSKGKVTQAAILSLPNENIDELIELLMSFNLE